MKFTTYQEANFYAKGIKKHFFGTTTLSNIPLNLSESDVFYYLLDEGYNAKEDRGRFLDLVISSLVDTGVNIVNEPEKEEFACGGFIKEHTNKDFSYLTVLSDKFNKDAESLVIETLINNEICVCKLKKIIGRNPDYPTQKIGNLTLTKCFLRPYYNLK